MRGSRAANPRQRLTTPTLTDPRLAALLAFLDASRDDDQSGRRAALYARADAAAARLLDAQPITSAFALVGDRPTIYDEVCRTIREDVPNWTDPESSERAFNAIEDAWHERAGAAVRAWDVTETMPSYIEHAVLLGACIMYRLLAGGAR